MGDRGGAMLSRVALAAGVVLAAAAPAQAGTRTYSSGPLALAIPESGVLEHPIAVRDAGPVSHVAVSVRLDHARVRDLTLALVAPSGAIVVLVAARGGSGRNFGRGAGCGGQPALFVDGADPVAAARAPFTHRPYAPEQPLAALRWQEARGRWTLRVADSPPGAAGTLRCWKLELSRDVREVRRTRRGRVTAELSFRESAGVYREPHLRILRAGRVAYSRRLRRLGCGGCPTWRPIGPPIVRNLDGAPEPEVVLDVYSGGAHCCTYSLIHRYLPERGRYVRLLHWWGNPGYRLADLDGDGRVEFRTTDDRFAYAFAAYVASLKPIRIWRYDHGRMRDVTRSFRGLIERDARSLWAVYLRARRAETREVRGILAAWLADMLMLGRGGEGWRRVELAYRRGDVGRGATMFGYPAGRRYLAALRNFLRRTGYQ
jgi:subtilisin-like proprotein convertase family protein